MESLYLWMSREYMGPIPTTSDGYLPSAEYQLRRGTFGNTLHDSIEEMLI